ncbi:MAG: hypothetical protein KF729_05980 [Sandaracinaceae bacterium]|nr:hypothetical protein [Sandaracinaceae bacterium]
MLLYIYLFSVIVGGILLAASILLGGKDADTEASAEVDLDADADADAGEADVGAHGDIAGFLYLFLSLRFWTFFLAFFGLTGVVLDVFGLVSHELIGLALAVGMGATIGTGASWLIRKLSKDAPGEAVRSTDYVGKTARVLVPFEGERVGKVRVEIGGNSIDLLATGVAEDTAGNRADEVLIVEMDGNRARVARLDAKKAG